MNILIVDDEALIREYIEYCTRECCMDCGTVESVSSGSAALRLLERKMFDIVMTDITMPRMDGLELLSFIREGHPTVSVVMLTCHDDFEFARTAIKNGAADYVLKSEMNPHAMAELIKKLEKQRARQRPESIICGRLALGQYLHDQFQDSSIDLLERMELEAQMNGHILENFAVCVFHYEKKFLDALAEIRYGWLRQQWTFLLMDDVVFNILEITPSVRESESLETLQKLTKMMQDLSDLPIGMSGIYHEGICLKRAVIQAFEHLDEKFYRRSAQKRDVGEENMQQLLLYRNNAIAALQNCDFPALHIEVGNIFSYARDSQVKVTQLKSTLWFICEIAAVKTAGLSDISKRIHDAVCIDNLEKVFYAFLDQQEKANRKYSNGIEAAVDYIRKYFRENVSLQDAAQTACLNTEYFSRRFKKETGMNFSEFLLSLRMQEAYRLLQSSNLRVSDVAEQIGIFNVSYFTSVFKQHFGMTPSEIRKK